MATLIRFTPDLSDWINDNLNQGHGATDLITVMHQQKMPVATAHAIVAAFIEARLSGKPTPIDQIEVPDQNDVSDYHYTTPIFRDGNRITTTDREIRITARAQHPTLALLSNVMSSEECAELIALAKPRLSPSTVVDPLTGRDKIAGHRSSSGMFFNLNETPFIARLDQRIAEIMNMPVEHGEGIQILYYPEGAESTPHYDFLVPSNAANRASLARSGQRLSTMVTYLNDVPEGGETIFTVTGWTITPQRGNAVYFEYAHRLSSNEQHLLDQTDHASLHASKPVTQGEKWVATKWMRQRPFQSATFQQK